AGALTRAATHTYVAPGSYPVGLNVRYPGGTEANASTIVIVVEPLTLTAPAAVVTEVGLNLTINASSSGGLAPFTFTWQGLPSGCRSQNLSVLVCTPTQSGDFPVDVEITDRLGATQSTNLLLTVADAPSVHLLVTTNRTGSCADPRHATVGLAATTAGGVTPLALAWTGPNGSTRSGANPVWTVLAAVPATFTVHVTDSLGGSANASVTLTPSLPDCPSAAPSAFAVGSAEIALVGLFALVVVAAVILLWRRRR
ncbi:MAG: hypothetical protein L3J73_03790, partial [Thermoplasmata archaeon]|nr:hypothetical protein [Thermoplasmata archaeon]